MRLKSTVKYQQYMDKIQHDFSVDYFEFCTWVGTGGPNAITTERSKLRSSHIMALKFGSFPFLH
jgi:hypothetical protein